MTDAELDALASRVADLVIARLGRSPTIGERRARRLERQASRSSDDLMLERMGLVPKKKP